MKPLPTMWILCGLGFLALGCQAGRLQWADSGSLNETAARAQTADEEQSTEGQIDQIQYEPGQFGPRQSPGTSYSVNPRHEEVYSGGAHYRDSPPPVGSGDEQHHAGSVRPVKVPYFTNCWPTSECVLRMKYHHRAASAFQRCRRGSGPASRDYRIGFEQGYIDLARGGLGRTPATAPHKYWGPAYRNPAGQAQQQDWLAGYTAGTEMAAEDGLSQYYPVSPNPDAHYFRSDRPSWAKSPGY